MTNFERIKAMNVPEMVRFLLKSFHIDCFDCPFSAKCVDTPLALRMCTLACGQWLESEVEEDDQL